MSERRQTSSTILRYRDEVIRYVKIKWKVGAMRADVGASDIAQEVVSLPCPTGMTSSRRRAWRFQAADNRVHNAFRKHARDVEARARLGAQVDEVGDDDPARGLQREEDRKRVHEFLERLSDEERSVVLLRVEGHTFRSIGEKLRMPESTVRDCNARVLGHGRTLLARAYPGLAARDRHGPQ